MVDRTIAHPDRRGAGEVTMTYEQMHRATQSCEEIAKPYIALLTGKGYAQMTPVEQTDWWRIFDGWRGR